MPHIEQGVIIADDIKIVALPNKHNATIPSEVETIGSDLRKSQSKIDREIKNRKRAKWVSKARIGRRR